MSKTKKCPECGSLLEFKIIDHTQGWYCDNCEWNMVTSYISPIDKDSNTYKAFNKTAIKANISQIKIVSEISNVNFLTAREVLENENSLICIGKAKDIMEHIVKLREHGIDYRIEPTYPYALKG